MVIEPAFGTFGSVGRCQVLLENEISISIKLVSRKEAWSALKFPGRWLRWLWTSENTVDQHQQMTWQPMWKLHTGLHTASPLFLQTLGPWFPNEMQNLLSSEKRTLDHWATVQFFFSTAQVRCFWRCLWFRSGLVALFLKTSERGDSWCTDTPFPPRQFQCWFRARA